MRIITKLNIILLFLSIIAFNKIESAENNTGELSKNDNESIALKYFIEGKYRKAKNILEKEIKNNPENLIARANLANVYFMLGKNTKAIDQAKYVLERKDDLSMYILLFSIYRFSKEENKNFGKISNKIDIDMLMEKAIKAYPGDIELKFHYIQYLGDRKRYYEACSNLISITDDDIKIYSQNATKGAISVYDKIDINSGGMGNLEEMNLKEKKQLYNELECESNLR